jgi:predicted nucleic acid-binding protein
MSVIFLDASALVKRYIDENGSEKVRALMNSAERIMVSRLAWPEALSALMRRRPTLDLTDEEFSVLLGELRRDWHQFGVLEINDHTVDYVDRVIEKHKLRGADSIHLSSAIYLKQVTQLPILFVAADEELLKAARKERLKTLNPNHFSAADTLRV